MVNKKMMKINFDSQDEKIILISWKFIKLWKTYMISNFFQLKLFINLDEVCIKY